MRARLMMNGRFGLAQRLAPLVCGLVLAVAGIGVWLELAPTPRSLLFWMCVCSAAGGALMLGAALLLPPGRVFNWLRWTSINGLVLGALLGSGEIVCRLAGVNFTRLSQGDADPRAAYPLCFHEPAELMGTIYFKRPGSQSWTGRPLTDIMSLYHATDHAYEDERPFTLAFDHDGFRNPPGMTDWDVVVVGDSFTEAGYQPFEQIYTSVAAARSGLRIRNLANCNTGPFTQMEFLRRFGHAPSCRIAVMGFFEGNDIRDARHEADAQARFAATGERPLREIGPQMSLLKALYLMMKSRVHFDLSTRYQNAVFIAGGKERPITLKEPPLPEDPETLSPEERALVSRFLNEWRDLCTESGLLPALLYIPGNNRIYHGLTRIDPDAPAALHSWRPTALPAFIRKECETRGIAFIDSCPALRAAAETGVLVYNPIFDTHFNQEGSRLAGEVLAGALKAMTEKQRTAPK